MKNPDVAVYIGDMKDCSQKVFKLAGNKTYKQFEEDMVLRLAVERLFEIIGEAANRIPKDFQQKHPSIPWAQVIGLRNLIIHAYDTINPERLFKVIEEDLESLLEELNKIVL
jgi:uncharacterized protein with HEPN domain